MSKGITHATVGTITSLVLMLAVLGLIKLKGLSHAETPAIITAIMEIIKQYWLLFVLMVPVCIFFSLLVDIDHKMTSITWFNFIVSFLLILFGTVFGKVNIIYVGLAVFGITIICAQFVPHRGPIHTLWFIIAAPFMLLAIKGLPHVWHLICVGIFCGWLHLLLDKIPFKISLRAQKC